MNESLVKKTIENTVTLANATDLVADIVLKISGNDVSNSLNGAIVKRPLICTIAQSRIRQKLAERSS
jgi:hypothetical protein